MVFGIRISDVT